MKTAATLFLTLVLLFAGDLANAQRRCCRCQTRAYYARVNYCEPTCGLPKYAGAICPAGTVMPVAPTFAYASAYPMPALPTGAATVQPIHSNGAQPAQPKQLTTLPDVVSSTSPTTSAGGTTSPSSVAAPSSGIPVAIEAIQSPSDGVSDDDLAPKSNPLAAASKTSDDENWRSLFDGKKLGDWEITKFGGEGEVAVEDGHIFCDFGQYITGVTYKGKDLPTNNYEIELEAQRVDGGDFFCGLTFPVDEKHATFVCGGWGGSVTGISSIDQYDASENDTTDYMEFKNKQWYKIRVRVTKNVLEAWINDKKMVNKEVESSRLSTRLEVDPCKPLGVCCFDTQAAYRNIRIRRVTGPESKGKKPAE